MVGALVESSGQQMGVAVVVADHRGHRVGEPGQGQPVDHDGEPPLEVGGLSEGGPQSTGLGQVTRGSGDAGHVSPPANARIGHSVDGGSATSPRPSRA